MFTRLACVSVAVPRIEDALADYTEGLGLDLIGEIHQGKRGYGLRFANIGRDGQTFIELLDAEGDGPVRRFLDREGSGVYQIRLETDNLRETVKGLKERGVEVIIAQPVGGGSAPDELTPDTNLAFVHPKSTSGVLIELVERKGS
ncbi:MAG: hypothetical protein GEU28_07930 [Dehalococcoidia bacterium]|nr:hypothetical protein [Dehalococcoidia bacterium]